MEKRFAWCSAGFSLVLFGCAAGSATAETPTESPSKKEPVESNAAETSPAMEEQAAESVDGKQAVPETCHAGTDPCLPNPKWAARLCQDVYPAVALMLFQKSSPVTRGYLTRKTKAVNASGGATSGEEWLVFDEEVVLVNHRSADLGGMQVSGAMGGYDALRLDGSCVTLGADEVRLQRPPTPKYTKVPWRYLGDDMEDALLDHEGIKEAYIARRKECKGAFSGTVTQKCIQLDEKLNRVIVGALVDGETDLPEPELRP